MIMTKIKFAIKNFLKFLLECFYRLLPDKLFCQIKYYHANKRHLNLSDPQTFNEKLNWLKIYDRKPEYTTYVDKYAVREFVSKIIGEQYLIPLLGVWNTPDEIDFDKLPNQFVFKCNHDSGGLVICKDKSTLNIKEVKRKLWKSLNTDFYLVNREYPYKNVLRKIICEQYMEDSLTGELRDYKFFCFNGKALLMFIATDRQRREEPYFDFFDMNFKHLNIVNLHPNSINQIAKPLNFNLMKELAEKVSKCLLVPQARIDFYEINGKVYFGEITLYHFGGFIDFKPDCWNKILGDYIKLPKKYRNMTNISALEQ